MDLERRGRPDLGWWFLERHAELLGDHWPPSLAHHHIAYRAQVRAKVACARARQGVADAEDLAARLLDLAARHLDAGRVRLILVGGTPGTGKSTIATALGGELDAFVVRSDEVRKQLVGVPAGTHAPAVAWAGIYDHATTATTYATLLDHAGQLLELGHSVVLDATWPTAALRRDAAVVAARSSAGLTALRCVAPRRPRRATHHRPSRARYRPVRRRSGRRRAPGRRVRALARRHADRHGRQPARQHGARDTCAARAPVRRTVTSASMALDCP